MARPYHLCVGRSFCIQPHRWLAARASAVLRTPDKKDPNMEKGFSCRAFSYTGWQGPSRDAEAGGVTAVT